jgi:hypothetical protein
MAEQQRRIAESAASRARVKRELTTKPSQVIEPISPGRLRRYAQAALNTSTEKAIYEDETGRKWLVLVPVGKPEQAAYGIVLGPPDVREILPSGYPEAVLFTLHEELFNRGLFTEKELMGRGQEIQAALAAALRLDVQAIMRAYKGE